MGIIQELADIFGKLKFCEMVHEYQQGLYFRNGSAIERPIRGNIAGLEDIVKEEQDVIELNGGYHSFIIPFAKPQILPPGYKRSFWTGLPKSPKRYSKVLKPGIYFHFPFVDSVVLEYNQEKVINLDNITVPTMDADSKVVILSCNIRYRMADFYKAYTVVHDFEKSLKDYTLAILAQNSRGKTYDDWKNPKVIERLQDKVLMELREVVTEKWGLEIYKVYVTDNVYCVVQRVLHEGPPLVVNNSPTPNSQEREAA